MARHLSIPLLLEVATLESRREVAEAEAHPDLTRGFDERSMLHGRLAARSRQARIVQLFQTDAGILNVFRPRESAVRAEAQSALEARLSARVAAGTAWTAEDIERLGQLVREGAREREIGVALQGLLGRLFIPGYGATPRSFAAAKIIGDWPRVSLPVAWWWKLSGRLRRAQDVIWTKAGGDPDCIHATAIGLHNLVDSLLLMSRLMATPGRRARLTEGTLVEQCLVAPESLLRRTMRPLRFSFLESEVGRDALVTIDAAAIQRAEGGQEAALFVGQWNQCPAHRLVPALLLAVWQASEKEPGSEGRRPAEASA